MVSWAPIYIYIYLLSSSAIFIDIYLRLFQSAIMHLQIVFSIFTSFFFLLMLFKSITKKSRFKSNTPNLPPGPWKLPLIGNLHQVFGSMPHHCFTNLAAKYGPLMHLKLGEVSNIIVTSPEMAQHIMKTHDLNFCERPQLLLSGITSYNGKGIAFSPYGDYWRQMKKICTMELLTTKRVQSFRHIREEEVSLLVKTLYASEGSIVNLSEKVCSITYGIAARAAFGKKNSSQKAFISAIDELLRLMGANCIADLYPSIGVLQKMDKTKAKAEELHRETDRILQEVIDEHKNRKSSLFEGGEDLVDVLLKFQQEKDSEYYLNDENIKAVIQDMFVGGGETSTAVVEWAMTEMIRNPKVMESAQAEVRKVYASKGYVDESELHQLTYLKSVIKETLRLHPSVPFLVPRENRERCQIEGYEIPAKCRVIINAWAIGRDPRYWIDAKSFIPERFLNSTIDYRGTNFEYIPFGAGRRMCPGIAFATPNMELPLAQLLYHFDWKLPNGMKHEKLDMTEAFGITLRRQNDLCLIPVSHQPKY